MKTRYFKAIIAASCLLCVLTVGIVILSFIDGSSTEAVAAALPATIEVTSSAQEAIEIQEDTEIIEEEEAEKSLRDAFAALIDYARRRGEGAAVYGAHIRAGRHYPDDIDALLAAIDAAAHALGDTALSDTQISMEIYRLNLAIAQFRYAIIDPYNRYRPYLATIAIGEDIPQKHHLRAAWIATVINIDWPSTSARGTTPAHVDRQIAELTTRFDEMAALNMNAVIFQISPTADAFYNSDIVPWSAWLTGETNFTGQLLDSQGNVFDPLQTAIDLARQRNMEIHAWFNPYRITHSLVSYTRGDGIILSSAGRPVASLAEIREEWSQIPGNIFATLGQYIHQGEGRYVLDPGVPAARQWIVARVMEVVENYDIDAIHFDDYFYPSGWNDDAVAARYNTGANNWISGHLLPDRGDWRRENTEMLIREVNDAIKEAAPWVRFGISPGGVWISGDGSTGYDGGGFSEATGSASTTSWSNFHSSYADTRRWVIENFIDYITPQIYWDWSLPAAPYGPIADWWGRLIFDFGPEGELRNSQGKYTTTHLYIGIGLYRMVGSNVPAKWRNGPNYQDEGKRTFLRQEHYNLGNPNIHGSMIFSHNHIRPGREAGLWDTMTALRDNAWRYPALVPAFEHLGGTAPAAPVDVHVEDGMISWRDAETNESELVRPRYFVIYASREDVADINNPANIYAILPAMSDGAFYEHPLTMDFLGLYSFAVTSVNRLHQESGAGRE